MTAASVPAPTGESEVRSLRDDWRIKLSAVLLPFVVLLLLRPVLPDWAVTVPESWVKGPESQVTYLVDGINGVVEVLRKHEIFGLFTFKDMTRAVAKWIDGPLKFMERLLIKGFGEVPSLPWFLLASLAAIWGWALRGWWLSLLAGGTIVYFVLVGKWKLSMITLSAVLVAAPVAAALGLALGILAIKWRPFEKVLWPILNIMQSMPHFSYLIPVALFIGTSHRAGAIATILFAIPPMARLTILGLRGNPPEVIEAGVMAGCTPRQMLWKVEIPAARSTLMVGINQVIMQCLAMVVIASFVGAKGLGQELLRLLQSLQLGKAALIGVAIVLMAIMLDRLSQAWATKEPAHLEEGPLWKVHPYWTAAAAIAVVSLALSFVFPEQQIFSRAATNEFAKGFDGWVKQVTLVVYEPMQIFRDGLLVHVLIPMRTAFESVPWVAAVLGVGLAGWFLGGLRVALICTFFMLFVAFSGFWPRALITAYMVVFAVLVCILIGLPIGILAAHSDRATKFMQVMCDTFQTFPSFIYLIPVIMLFKVGDVAAIAAIVIYASIPVIRYTMLGLRGVPREIIEAAITSGCTPAQILWKVRMPMAFPEIMLGLNQTIMFALFMVIIAAFIGTTDLGQEIFRALTFADAGKGLVIGLCVAFLGLTADQLITTWAAKRKAQLGLV